MIQAKYQTPALFFILATAAVAIVWLVPAFRGSSVLDLDVHDTYYVISHNFIFFVLSLYFVACALLYLIFLNVARNRMSAGLGHVHFWLSAISVGILVYSLHKMQPLGTDVARAQAEMDSLAELGFLAFFGFLAAQIVFVVNVIWAFSGRKGSTSTEP